jgi:hypothetical protein
MGPGAGYAQLHRHGESCAVVILSRQEPAERHVAVVGTVEPPGDAPEGFTVAGPALTRAGAGRGASTVALVQIVAMVDYVGQLVEQHYALVARVGAGAHVEPEAIGTATRAVRPWYRPASLTVPLGHVATMARPAPAERGRARLDAFGLEHLSHEALGPGRRAHEARLSRRSSHERWALLGPVSQWAPEWPASRAHSVP